MPETPRNATAILFSALCLTAMVALIYFARSAATQSAPQYSTWNTRPEGEKLVFDGLNEAGLVRVSRQFKPVNIEKPNQATVFFLGVQAGTLDDADERYIDTMEAAANLGNNVVIAIPESDFTFKSSAKPQLLQKRWGVRFVSDKGIFTEHPILDNAWEEQSTIGHDVWQKPFGKGRITIVAKAQRLSNKGIATDAANRQLLYGLVSQYPSAVFEEAHLGIRESGSIVGLARHYHLQGLIAGLMLLAGLFIWSHSVRFPPPLPEPAKRVAGSDSRSVLAELMTRYLTSDLLATCVHEWKRSHAHGPAITLPPDADVVRAYTEIQKSLETRSRFTI